MSGKFRIDRVTTSGFFELDGSTWNVDNNVWVIGDDDETSVIDAVDGRNVVAIVCTHGHSDHVSVAPDLGVALCAPVVLHPGDQMLWDEMHPEFSTWPAVDRQRIAIAGSTLAILHTPGHSPGSICLHLPRTALPLLWRYAVLGRSGGNWPFVLRLPDDHWLHTRTAIHTSREHKRFHRPRRDHLDRN
jgi:hypothetical protein